MKIFFVNFILLILTCTAKATPQSPEINDQFEESNHTELLNHEEKNTEVQPKHTEVETNTIQENQPTSTESTTKEWTIHDVTNITYVTPQPSFISKIYHILTRPMIKFIAAPKVNAVFKNIGTCIVNGAMEIVSFYFPAPLIPLIASAAGLIIPFEPVIMLKEKMPVTSYRRAFKKAVSGFLGTFDRYKYEEEDPYMTRRFNRRFMQNSKEKYDDDS